MNNPLQYIIIILEFIHIIFGVFGIAVYKISKGGKLFPNILLCWGLIVLWAVIWCVILPLILLPFGEEILMLFPEAIGVPAVIFTGWLPSMLVCSIAFFTIKIKNRSNPETSKKSLAPPISQNH